MAREQIRVRVDGEQWERWRAEGESNTELLDRILQDWQQQQRILAALTELDPNPAQALGRLLTSHELMSQATVTLTPGPALPATLSPPPDPPPRSPITAPPSMLIDGLENNGDDW